MSRCLQGMPIVSACVMALASFVLAESVDPPAGRMSLQIIRDGSPVELSSDAETRLAAQTVTYFETCHTHEAVTGESAHVDDLRRRWREQERGPYLLVNLPRGVYGTHRFVEPSTILIGLSSGSAAPVLTRDADGSIVLYAKCDGLGSLLLACDIYDVTPVGEVPEDCDRLRELEASQVKH